MASSRKERREEERLGAKVAKRALPLYPDSPTRQPIRLKYAGALAAGTQPAQLLETARREADEAGARAFAKSSQPACKAGCAYCCHLFISVRAHEARSLASVLRRLPAHELDALKLRLTASAARAKGTTSATYPKGACALLSSEGTCIAYDARPFTCREYHSYDVEMCRRDGVEVPSSRLAFAAHQDVSLAFTEAIASVGGDASSYELQQALDILLGDPKGDLAPARER